MLCSRGSDEKNGSAVMCDEVLLCLVEVQLLFRSSDLLVSIKGEAECEYVQKVRCAVGYFDSMHY